MKDRATFDNSRLLKQLSDLEPRPEAVQRALDRTRQALTSSPSPAQSGSEAHRWRGNSQLLRVAAVTAAALMVAVGAAYFLFFAKSGATSAFAEVQTAIARVSCVTVTVEVLKAPKGLVAHPGTYVVDIARKRSRFDSADGTEVYVIDFSSGMWMVLHRTQKQASIMQMRNSSESEHPSFAEFLELLRECDAGQVEQLKDVEINGRRVDRYRVLPESRFAGGVEMMLVFVDPRTHLPVRIEQMTNKLGGPLHLVCKDFSFGECDPALFAMVPPEGYRVWHFPESDLEEPQQLDE